MSLNYVLRQKTLGVEHGGGRKENQIDVTGRKSKETRLSPGSMDDKEDILDEKRLESW